jgi:hypothetical protein
VSAKKATVVRWCTCEHKAQDGLHREHMRVYNRAPGKGGSTTPNRYRCTVCRKEVVVGE